MEKKENILVVDDEVEICELIQSHIEGMTNYGVFITHCIDEAIIILQREDIAAVISDVRMPEGDGMELLNTIKSTPPPRPHVIIISGLSKDDEEGMVQSDGLLEHITHEITRDEVKEKGGYSYLSKPLDYEELIKLLDDIIESK